MNSVGKETEGWGRVLKGNILLHSCHKNLNFRKSLHTVNNARDVDHKTVVDNPCAQKPHERFRK